MVREVLIAYAVMSAVAFVLYWRDKLRAERGRWRVPEATLHTIELVGGWPGALVAQRVLRHKSSKPAYQIVFWTIGAAHAAGWLWWWVR
jgi:uncharacterized membrane protein YsdA (DUF1294 family)